MFKQHPSVLPNWLYARRRRSAARPRANSEPTRAYWDRYWLASKIADAELPRPGEDTNAKKYGEWLLRHNAHAKGLAQRYSLKKLRKMCAERGVQVPESE